jgi:hypothetical protein
MHDSWREACGLDRAVARRDATTHGYDLASLRTDLARFTFLLGHDDGEHLFGTGEN